MHPSYRKFLNGILEQKDQNASDSELQFLQRVKLWSEKISTCQILN